MRIMIRQLAPGMVQQMQSVCTDCNGEGNMFIEILTVLRDLDNLQLQAQQHLKNIPTTAWFPVQVR